jgi:hypothetical protein
LTPVTCGWVAGVVAPLKIVTLAGEMDTFVESELDRLTVTPVEGAGVESVTGNAVD